MATTVVLVAVVLISVGAPAATVLVVAPLVVLVVAGHLRSRRAGWVRAPSRIDPPGEHLQNIGIAPGQCKILGASHRMTHKTGRML